MKKILDKEKRKSLRRTLRRIFRKENMTKIVIVIATLGLILASVLPYVLL